MVDDLKKTLEEDLEDFQSLMLKLIAAEAMTRRSDSGPLARPWAVGGPRTEGRARVVSVPREDKRRG